MDNTFLNPLNSGMMDASSFEEMVAPLRAAVTTINENQKAATKGDPKACTVLAESYRFLGEISKAVMWYKKAHSLDHPSAALEIARVYGAREDYNAAKKWYQIMVERGDDLASFELALIQQNSTTSEGSLDIIKGLAEKGLPQACDFLGQYYEDEQEDIETAEKWFLKAGQAAGAPAYVFHDIALFYEKTNRPAQYEEWLRKAAEAGEADAQYGLFYLLHSQQKLEEASKFLDLAASQNQPEALVTLAQVIEKEQDLPRAKSFYFRAALAGEPHAMYRVAQFYVEDNNLHEALNWCKASAERGHEEAGELFGELRKQHTCGHHH